MTIRQREPLKRGLNTVKQLAEEEIRVFDVVDHIFQEFEDVVETHLD